MQKFLIRIILVFMLLGNTCAVWAQGVHPIDSVMDLSPYYLPTYYSNINAIEYESLVFNAIDTTMVTTHLFYPLLKTENIYQSLGIAGQAHQSIIFDFDREMGFLYQELPYPLYFKTLSNMPFYKLQTTYSKVAYTFGFPNKTNQIYADFARYMKGVTLSIALYGTFNNGTFINQKTSNLCGDFLVHYETPSSIYGLKAVGIINHLNNTENGGLKDINSYQEREMENDGGYATFFDDAGSRILSFDVALQNYVNIKNKKNKYFGTFSYDFQVSQSNLTYHDKFDSLPSYYNAFDTLKTVSNDSIRFLTLKNVLQWSNFMPYKEMKDKNNFFHIAGGAMHEYTKFKHTNVTFNSLYLFARTHIRLFRVMDINAKISYSLYGYTSNDLLANAGISWSINRAKDHAIGINANFYRTAPEYALQHFESNHFQWDTTFAKQNIVQLKAFWEYENYNVSVSYYYLNKLVYLSDQLRPIQDHNMGNMIQVSSFIPFRYKNFGTTANLNVQYCSNDVILVPIFAGKLSIFYIFELLKKRLKIQLGTDLMYNTSYYADGYVPALRMFHYQNTQLTGNFVYWDANITFQIERICFFFRAGNLLPPLMHYRNFTTPNYPMKDYFFNIGITWKFFD